MQFLRTAMKSLMKYLVFSIALWSAASVMAYDIEFGRDQWQLISFPRLPADKSVESIFGESANNGDVQAIWTFDNDSKRWARWPDDTDGVVDSIAELSTGQGYWVQTVSDFTLQIDGEDITAGGQVLYPGWNLIGIVGDDDMPHEQAFAGVSFLELWRYNSATNGFQVVQKSGGSQIIIEEQFLNVETTKGYWLYVTEQTSLVPQLGTLLPPDIDIEPLLVMPKYGEETLWTEVTPGDVDWDEDGFFDFPNTQETLAFGDFLNRQRIAITNEGNAVLSWTATIEPAVDWLLFEAHDEDGNYVLTNNVRGNVADANGELIAVVNRVGLAPSENYTTEIVLRANGAVSEKRIQVKMAVADVVGDYEFTVRLDQIGDKQADLHNPKYFMSLARDGDGVKAFLDEERSLLIPETTYLSGSYISNPENHFQILGQLYLPQGHEHNPYQSDIRREFVFIGQRSDGLDGLSPLDLKGTYNENVYGIYDDPIQIKGEFVARRTSPVPVSQDNTLSDPIQGHILSMSEDDGYGAGISEFYYEFPERYSITDVKTSLQISHTSPESLKIELVGPGSLGSVILHDQESRSVSNLRFDDYDPSIESLDVFDGEIARGNWTLRITNTSDNIGVLNNWTTEISGANVYQISGQTTPGVRLQLSGCGVTRTVTTDSETGSFLFDGLVPCDYEISVLQLGYDVTTTSVRIVGCYKSTGNECNQDSDYIIGLTSDQLAELSPQLNTDTGEMKVIVSPVRAFLPNGSDDSLSVQSIDVTNYYSMGEALNTRRWSLHKRINPRTSISDSGYLIETEADGSSGDRTNYIAYSQDHTKWGASGNITLAYTDDTKDPRGGNSATKVSHSGDGSSGWVYRSDVAGEGSFAVSAGEFITMSAFLKAGTTSQFRFRAGNGNTYLAGIKFDLTSGEYIGGSGSNDFLTESLRSVPMANGWYRVEATYQADANYPDFHCDAWYISEGTFNVATPGDVYVYGPQCEKNSSVEQAVMSGYIPTGYNHGSRTDTAMKVASAANGAAIWSNRFQGRSDQAGEYFITLESDVRDSSTNELSVASYQTEDILLQFMPTDSIHFGAVSTYAAAGTTSLRAMDAATFDINRPPLESLTGPEDSDSFTAEVDDATETNSPNNLLQDASNPGQYSFEPSGFNDPVGNQALHYRMYISTGQLIFSPSAYSTGIRLDQGIQSADTDSEDRQAVYKQNAGGQ